MTKACDLIQKLKFWNNFGLKSAKDHFCAILSYEFYKKDTFKTPMKNHHFLEGKKI